VRNIILTLVIRLIGYTNRVMRNKWSKTSMKKESQTLRVFLVVLSLFFYLVFYKIDLFDEVEAKIVYLLSGIWISLFMFPGILKYPYRVWMIFGKFLSRVLGPIEIGILYYLALLPFAILYRFKGSRIVVGEKLVKLESTWKNIEDKVEPSYFERSF
jgi:hypothetical protein